MAKIINSVFNTFSNTLSNYFPQLIAIEYEETPQEIFFDHAFMILSENKAEAQKALDQKIILEVMEDSTYGTLADLFEESDEYMCNTCFLEQAKPCFSSVMQDFETGPLAGHSLVLNFRQSIFGDKVVYEIIKTPDFDKKATSNLSIV